MTLTGPCAAWGDPDDLSCLDSLAADDKVLVGDAATELLFNATAQAFPGECSDTVRPCLVNLVGMYGLAGQWGRLDDGSMWLGVDGTSTLPESTWGGFGGWTGLPISGGILAHSTVELPNFPIRTVTKVTIDGTDLAPGSWLIVDDRWLVRADGQSWPFAQRLDLPAGSPSTWTIEYGWGAAPPAAGVLAWRVLACELGKSVAGDESCRLPKRLQNLTREGVSMVVLDAEAQTGGDFGIYEIDQFVKRFNPGGLDRQPKVINVDLIGAQTRRVR